MKLLNSFFLFIALSSCIFAQSKDLALKYERATKLTNANEALEIYQGIINVGTGKDITIKELVNTISELFKYDGKILWDQTKPDGTPRKLLDVSKINNLGWQASTRLKDGISLTIDHFKSDFLNKKVRQ